MRWAILVLLACSGCVGSCDASSVMAGVRAAQAAGPALGPGYVDGFKVSCDDADAGADAIAAPGQVSYSCRVSEDGGNVWIGDSAVANNGSTGGEYYKPGEFVSGNVKKEYCRTVTGTTNLFCRAMVSSEP